MQGGQGPQPIGKDERTAERRVRVGDAPQDPDGGHAVHGEECGQAEDEVAVDRRVVLGEEHQAGYEGEHQHVEHRQGATEAEIVAQLRRFTLEHHSDVYVVTNNWNPESFGRPLAHFERHIEGDERIAEVYLFRREQ